MSVRKLTSAEAAERIGCSVSTLHARCAKREWPHQRIGREYRFTEAQIEQIEQLITVDAEPDAPRPDKPVGMTDRSARHHRRRRAA